MTIVKHFLSYVLATGFGTGYAPVAPGTAGSLLALCLYVLIPLSEMQWILIIAITIYLGIITGTYVEKRLNKDPGIVVIDEMAGLWLSQKISSSSS